MKCIKFTFSDGKTYAVMAKDIAENKAFYYAKKEGDTKEKFDKIFQEEFDFMMNDEYELLDWMSNNMDFSDLNAFLIKTEINNSNYNEEFPNLDKKIVELDENILNQDNGNKELNKVNIDSVEGVTFCFTGVFEKFKEVENLSRAEIISLVENKGGIVKDSIVNSVNFLVIGKNPGSKLLKAEEKGINKITEEQFRKMLGV